MKKLIILTILVLISCIPSYADKKYEMPDYYNIDEPAQNNDKKGHFAFSINCGTLCGDPFYLGIALRGEKVFNKYISLDYLTTRWYFSPKQGPADLGIFGILPFGVRLYTPKFLKNMRAYTNLDLGWTMVYLKYSKFRWDDSIETEHRFTVDFGLGIQLSKRIALGYSLTKMMDFDVSHGAKISFIF